MIYCSTGCSCCRNENHYTGPYRSEEDAINEAAKFKLERRLASQYAPNGVYGVEKHSAEVLPDGRVILCGRVFQGFEGRYQSPDGNVVDYIANGQIDSLY